MGFDLEGRFETLGTVLCRVDFVAVTFEVVFHELEDVGFVVDEQYAVSHSESNFLQIYEFPPEKAAADRINCVYLHDYVLRRVVIIKLRSDGY